MEISKITPNIYVSGDPMFSPNLKKDVDTIINDVDIVIDLRAEVDDEGSWKEVLIERFGSNGHIIFAKVPMHDDRNSANTSHQFFQVLSEMFDSTESNVMDKSTDPVVLLHCHMGINRAPSVAMFLMLALGVVKEPQEAFQKIVEARPIAGVAYSTDAVTAFLDLSQEADDEYIALWQSWERVYWNQHPERKKNIVKYMKDRRKQGHYWLDESGVSHMTA